jgi:hypothetical protein
MPGSYDEYPFPQKWAASLDYFPTAQGPDIYNRLLPEWATRFARGQQKYRDVKHLGAKGVFPDVNRKTARLESDIWHERTPPEGAEPTREVILDLIGHAFLMLHLWDQEPLHGLEELTDEEAQAFEQTITSEEAVQRTSQAAFDRSHLAQMRAESCPNPDIHGDGWDALPHSAREVLRRVAEYGRITNLEREQVKMLVEKHDAPKSG